MVPDSITRSRVQWDLKFLTLQGTCGNLGMCCRSIGYLARAWLESEQAYFGDPQLEYFELR